ncbi:MAG: hypothetical protein HY699_21055 [Deltaproteobacteria bacterium]|nr:hypothetical protein [Deltaproteobacteria bacterium]
MLSGSTHRKIWVVYNRTTRITVISVDGHSVDPSADEWAVLPGPHAVTTAYWVNHLFLGPGSSFASITRPVQVRLVEFTGQPGHRYRVDGRAVDIPGAPSQYPAWVEDIETGDIVGGSKDPETAPLTRRE